MKTLLVTGGAGFIGANFVHFLIGETDVQVVNLDKLTYAGNLDTLAPLAGNARHVFVRGDIGDRDLVRRLLADYRVDAVVNFAAESHVDRSIDGPAAFVETNVVGTFNLLDCARAHWSGLGAGKADFRFLHVSTDEVYGSLGPTGRFTETTAYAPNSPYSASKAASDHLVRAWRHTYGLPVLTTNCSNNYGPYQFPEKLIPLVILKAMRGEPLPITAMAAISAIGSTSRITAAPSGGCWRPAALARSTTWAGTASAPTCRWSIPCAACSTSCGRTRRTGLTPISRPSSPTGRGMIGATPSTRASCSPSWVGRRGRASRAAWQGRSAGISTTRNGASG